MVSPLAFVSDEENATLSHTYTRLIVHTIFSTKDRIAYLSEDRRSEVFRYMGGILRKLDCQPLHINGVADHTHMIIGIAPSWPVAEIIQKVKSNSTRWIHENDVLQRSFAWQRGYAAFSVSRSNLDAVYPSMWPIKRNIIDDGHFRRNYVHF